MTFLATSIHCVEEASHISALNCPYTGKVKYDNSRRIKLVQLIHNALGIHEHSAGLELEQRMALDWLF